MRRHHVSAGESFVGRTQPLVLEAYLASCVGLAAYDPKGGVGGMAHFLLPEPISSAVTPEKYAASGVPRLLRRLEEAGARRERLRAVIAGGALVGPVEEIDLNLNIGGRTAEITEQVLKDEGVPLERAETGGCLSIRLRLDMERWSWAIEPTGLDPATAERPARIPRPEDIAQAIERLQPIPQAALKILRLIDEEEYDIRRLAAELRTDQVLAARTLKIANSVMFANRNPIESIDHALMFLGVNLLAQFVIAAAIEQTLSLPSAGYSLCRGGLYRHAVGTAAACEQIARTTGRARTGLAYTAGLLHDVGKAVLDQFVAGAAPLFYRRLHENQACDFLAVEQEVLGTTHGETGFELAARWSFPESLAEAIRSHHGPEKAGPHAELCNLVVLANLITARFQAGMQIDRPDLPALAPRMQALGIPPERLPHILDALPPGAFASGAAAETAR